MSEEPTWKVEESKVEGSKVQRTTVEKRVLEEPNKLTGGTGCQPVKTQVENLCRPSPPSQWPWLDDVLAKLAQLGLGSRAYDADGRLLASGPAPGPFLKMLWQDACIPCDPSAGIKAFSADSSASQTLSCLPGCTCVIVPIQRRRRRLGVITASFVGLDLADTEQLARFCQAHRLDRTLMLRAARQEARYYSFQAPVIRQIAAMLIEQAVEHHVTHNELGELSANLTSTYEELSLVYKIAAGMTVTEKPADYLRHVGEELLEVMDVESLAIRYFRSDQPLISEHISIGAELTSPKVEQMMWDELLARFERKPEEIVDNLPAEQAGQLPSLARQGKIRRLAAVPMLRNGKLIGAIVAMNKSGGEFDSPDVKLMKSVADGQAVFLENAFLYEDLGQLLMGMLRALTSSIDAKDPYTCGHSERVALIARNIARSAGLDEFTVGRVYLSGLLHDIGKIGVPEAVLLKPGRLTKPEFAVMRKHSETGAKILTGIKQVEDLVAGVLFHHERMDGRGYPQGLAGDKIPLFGRIVGLADSFDAMTSNRTYRRALPLEVTLTEIRRYAGTQFDPRMVEAFLKLDPADLLRQTRSDDPSGPLNMAVRQSGPLPGGDPGAIGQYATD